MIVLKLALRALSSNESDSGELAAEALRNAERANSELRELAHGVLPAALTRGGLRAGVDALVARTSLPVSMDVSVGRLPAGLEATAYFVVSEALTNVVKHARAEAASVTARVEHGQLRVEFRDDGVGGARAGTNTGLGAWRTACRRWTDGWCWTVLRVGVHGCVPCCRSRTGASSSGRRRRRKASAASTRVVVNHQHRSRHSPVIAVAQRRPGRDFPTQPLRRLGAPPSTAGWRERSRRCGRTRSAPSPWATTSGGSHRLDVLPTRRRARRG